MKTTGVSFAQFFYRINGDRTIDSICGYCFLTVATAYIQAELRWPESTHHCVHPLMHAGDSLAQAGRGGRNVQ